MRTETLIKIEIAIKIIRGAIVMAVVIVLGIVAFVMLS